MDGYRMMNVCIDGLIDKWMGEWMVVCKEVGRESQNGKCGIMDRQMGAWTDRCMDEWKEIGMERQKGLMAIFSILIAY